MENPLVTPFFDEATHTFSYVVRDPGSRACALVDSVLDFDEAAGRTAVHSADEIIAFVEREGLETQWILETHVHADHLSAAPYLQQRLGGRTAIGAHIAQVQTLFGEVFNAGEEFARDGSQFDCLFEEGDSFAVGGLEARVLHTPGHTPACLTYLLGDAAFVGDTLFMPDYGTARCDFPGGDARTLYRSIQKVLALPPETRIFLCHDYKAPDRELYAHETTVAAQRRYNIHVHEGIEEDEFVVMRTQRDTILDLPRLMIPSVQVNMRAGHFPPPEENGQIYLKVPLNWF